MEYRNEEMEIKYNLHSTRSTIYKDHVDFLPKWCKCSFLTPKFTEETSTFTLRIGYWPQKCVSAEYRNTCYSNTCHGFRTTCFTAETPFKMNGDYKLLKHKLYCMLCQSKVVTLM